MYMHFKAFVAIILRSFVLQTLGKPEQEITARNNLFPEEHFNEEPKRANENTSAVGCSEQYLDPNLAVLNYGESL